MSPPPAAVVARLELDPPSLQLLHGASATLQARATSATGTLLPTPALTWSSGDAAVATISTAGVVTAVAAGSTTITARAGTLSATATVTVRRPPSYEVVIALDSGVTGTPAAGTVTVDSGTVLPYSYRARSGFQSLVVQRDTLPIASEGSLVINTRTWLIATTTPTVTLSPAAEGLVTKTRSVLTAADPAAALQQLLDDYRTFLGTGDTARTIELERLQRNAFRDVPQSTLDAFYRRLASSAAAGRASGGAKGSGGGALATGGTVVLYVNGILNSPTGAASSAADIATIATKHGHAAGLLYNPTWHQESGVSFLNCLLRVVDPRQWTSGSLSLLQCLPVLPDLAEAQAQIELVLAGASGTHPFVGQVRDRIVTELDAGRSVIFVAHSQGNLMVIEALRQLQQALPPSAVATAARCLATLSIASPLSDEFPATFGTRGMIVSGTYVRDVMLFYPGKNRFERIATNWTFAGDVLYPLLVTRFPVLIDVGAGMGLHLMGSYLGSGATRAWIDREIAQAGQRHATQCTDTVVPSTTSLTVPVGGTSSALTATRFTPTGKAVAGATFSWRSSSPLVARVVTSPAVQVIGVSPGTATIDVTSGSGTASIQVQVTPAPAVAVTLTSQPASVPPGGSATLTWASSNAASCSAGWTASTATSGTQQVSPATTTTYTMTCQGVGGVGSASTTVTVAAPPPPGAGNVLSLSAGGNQSCAVFGDGTARCWGDNLLGALGQDMTTIQWSRVPLVVRGGLRFSEIATGYLATCALESGGRPWCWGYNARAGLGTPLPLSDLPVQVPQAPTLRTISRGFAFACGVDGAGDVHCWGSLNGTAMSPLPGRVASSDRFQSVRGSFLVVCAIDTTQRAHCWGDNAWGGFGNGGQSTRSSLPIAVAGGHRWLSVAPGVMHTCGVTTTGEAYCWGMQSRGQLGSGNMAITTVLMPTPVTGGLRFTQLVSGDYHSCALMASGEAYCWGDNTNGQLGSGSGGDRAVPTPVAGGIRFRALSAGASHSCGIDLTDGIWCWGANDRGQLGDGGVANAVVPKRVVVP